METTLAAYEGVVRKVLAADGEARAAEREVVALLAAAAERKLMVKVSCTEAETISKVTAEGGTPASVATLSISSVRMVGVKSGTEPATMTVVERVAAVGGRGEGGGYGVGGGGGDGGGGGGGGRGDGGMKLVKPAGGRMGGGEGDGEG